MAAQRAADRVPRLETLAADRLCGAWHASLDLSRLPATLAKLLHERLRSHCGLRGVPLTAPMLCPFVSGCWQVPTLDLTGCRDWLRDGHLAALSYLTSLTAFTLKGAEAVTDAGLHFVPRQRRLEALDVSWCPRVSDAFWAQHAGHLVPSLTALNVSGTAITDAGVAALLVLTRLRRLALGATPITDLALDYLTYHTRFPGQGPRLQGLDDLQWLSVAATSITDQGLGKLCATDGRVVFKQLRLLVLSSTPKVGPRAVAEVRGRYKLMSPLPNAPRTLASSNRDALASEDWISRAAPADSKRERAAAAASTSGWECEGLMSFMRAYHGGAVARAGESSAKDAANALKRQRV